MGDVPGRSAPSFRCPHSQRPLWRRAAAGRIAGLALLFVVIGLPVLSNDHDELRPWDQVAVDGFAATTAWRWVDDPPGPPLQLDLVAVVGHNPAGTNQYQFHESTNLTFTSSVPFTVTSEITTSSPITITGHPDVAPGAGGCCAAPEAACNGDGTCTTAFRGGDGRFRELTISNNSASSVIIDVAALNQLSATFERWSGGVVATTSDTVALVHEIYLKLDGASNYTQIASPPCDSPLTNLHWATVTDPLDDWLISACRNGSNINLRQYALPAGTFNWIEAISTVPAPNAFRYLNLDHCGNYTFPDQSTGDLVAYSIPRNADTVVGVIGPVGNASAPAFNVSTVVSGTSADYFGLECANDLVTLVRPDGDGSGVQFLYFDFDQLSGSVNLESATDDSINAQWINLAPDYVGTISDTIVDTRYVDTAYLPLILKSGGLQGGQLTYGTVQRVLFFDGFESGDTRFWDTAVGLAGEDEPAAEASPGRQPDPGSR